MSITAELLKTISTILAHSAHPEEALHEIATKIGRQANLDQVRFSIQNPYRGTSVSAHFESATREQTGVALSRELRSGAFTFGHIEILSAKPSIRAVELFQFLSTLEAMVLNYSILEARKAEKCRLKATLLILQEEKRVRKLTPRAQSILASSGFSTQDASAWLENESRRSSVPLTIAAERLIGQQKRRQVEAA